MLHILLGVFAVLGLGTIFAVPFITHAQEQRRLRCEANRRQLLQQARLTICEDRRDRKDPRATQGPSVLKTIIDFGVDLVVMLATRKPA